MYQCGRLGGCGSGTGTMVRRNWCIDSVVGRAIGGKLTNIGEWIIKKYRHRYANFVPTLTAVPCFNWN